MEHFVTRTSLSDVLQALLCVSGTDHTEGKTDSVSLELKLEEMYEK